MSNRLPDDEPPSRASAADQASLFYEMMPDSLDLPGFSTRIDVRRLYPRNNRQSGVGTLAVVPCTSQAAPNVVKKKQGKYSMKFTGTKDYVATDDLKIAVNASIVLERPLLIKGE